MTASSATRLSRTVVDTNLLVSGLISAMGAPAVLIDALRQDRFLLLSSQPLTAEVDGVLARPSLARYSFDPALTSLVRARVANAEQVVPLTPLPVTSRDPKDDKFLACALGGAADYLVTSDQDLLVLDGHPALGTLRIITARVFLELLGITPP